MAFYYHSPPRMFLPITSRYSIWIFCRGILRLATDCPCGVWCRGLTTCLLFVGPLFWKSTFKQQLSCRLDIMDCKSFHRPSLHTFYSSISNVISVALWIANKFFVWRHSFMVIPFRSARLRIPCDIIAIVFQNCYIKMCALVTLSLGTPFEDYSFLFASKTFVEFLNWRDWCVAGAHNTNITQLVCLALIQCIMFLKFNGLIICKLTQLIHTARCTCLFNWPDFCRIMYVQHH